MKKSASILVFGAALVSAGLLEMAISAGTQEDNSDVFILEGLKGVSVEVIQPVSGFEGKPGFNPVKVDDLHATVERLLSNAGIEIVDSATDDPETGHLAVTINAWKGRQSIDFILQVKIELYQHATLVRDRGLQILTPTWPLGEKAMEMETPVVVTRGELARTVQDEMEAQVKMLIKDYFEANSQSEPKPDISGMMTDTVRRRTGYVIVADHGVQYDPVNLPDEFRRDGLRVAFRATRTKRTWLHPAVWQGPVVAITRIPKL